MSRRFTRIVLPAALAGTIALAGCAGSDPAAPGVPRSQAGPQAGAQVVGLTRDTEEDKSFPLPEGTRGGANAPLPTSVDAAPRMGEDEPSISPGAPTDAEVEAELREMKGVLKDLERRRRQTTSPAKARGALTRGGNVKTPLGAPARIAQVIAGGNAIARFPYVWGGGHGSFIDSAYDCSGSVSYALAAAGLLDAPARLRPVRAVGRARTRPLDHDLRTRRPRLHDRRRHPLRHERPRRPARLALADRAALDGRLQRPPPAGVVVGRRALPLRLLPCTWAWVPARASRRREAPVRGVGRGRRAVDHRIRGQPPSRGSRAARSDANPRHTWLCARRWRLTRFPSMPWPRIAAQAPHPPPGPEPAATVSHYSRRAPRPPRR